MCSITTNIISHYKIFIVSDNISTHFLPQSYYETAMEMETYVGPNMPPIGTPLKGV